MKVIEHHRQRLCRGGALQDIDHRCQSPRLVADRIDEVATGRRRCRRQALVGTEGTQHGSPRPQRGSVGGRTGTPAHARTAADTGGEMLHEPGLADAGLTDNDDEAPVTANGRFPMREQVGKLLLSADERVAECHVPGPPRADARRRSAIMTRQVGGLGPGNTHGAQLLPTPEVAA